MLTRLAGSTLIHRGFRVLTLILGLALCAGTAKAQAPVEWAVEAPITAIDPAARTITASGVVAEIPESLVIEGTNGITGATLNLLLDAAAPSRVRSVFASAPGDAVGYTGGTLKAEGIIVADPNGNVCLATAVVVELAENVVLGPLESVDQNTGTFVVNGVPCQMNADERFPAEILDAGFEPITMADLANGIGTLVGVVGYVHAGQMYAQAVDTEILPTNPGTDVVRITRAQGRQRNGNDSELRVDGVVSPFDANATITISDANTGAVLGTVPIALADVGGGGEFQLRLRNLATVPTRVRAVSSNGGTHEADVELR